MAIKQKVGVGISGISNYRWWFDKSDLANRCCNLAILVAGFDSFLYRFDRQDRGNRYDDEIGAEGLGVGRRSVFDTLFHVAIPSAIRCSRNAGIESRLSALSRLAKFSSSRSSRMSATMNSNRL